MPDFFAKLGAFLEAENAEILHEVDQLARNIEHIKEVVAMQQSYAKVSGVFEDLPAEQLVEDAIALNMGAFERHGVTLDRDFAAVPLVRVDRHKVLQILINLIRNAKYALDDSQRADKRLTIRIRGGDGAKRQDQLSQTTELAFRRKILPAFSRTVSRHEKMGTALDCTAAQTRRAKSAAHLPPQVKASARALPLPSNSDSCF